MQGQDSSRSLPIEMSDHCLGGRDQTTEHGARRACCQTVHSDDG
jgi:hypothetical protein